MPAGARAGHPDIDGSMGEAISRRRFLRRAGAIAWAAPFALDLPLAGRPLAPGHEPLRKCISLGGYAPLTVPDGHPNDYRLHGNREYIRDQSGTRWVKLWVSWAHLQQELAPASRAESWAQLNQAPAGEAALRRLDRQLRAVNEDALRVGGMGVILALYHDYPTWSSGAREEDPARGPKPINGRVPSEVSEDSPWGWFVEYLMARYRPGTAPNSEGPRAGAGPGRAEAVGNPDGAHIQALEICNEPNLLLWPQPAVVPAVAGMIKTATALAGAHGRPLILAPATSDFPDHPHDSADATDWLTFSRRLLERLDDFRPGTARVGWSHHNYLDVSEEVSGSRSRAQRVVKLLYRHNWRGGGDRRLWLTESGFNLYPRQGELKARLAQARKLERNFTQMSAQPEPFLWTQHTICDVPSNVFKSGLRDDFVPGAGPGAPRPAWDTWARLPGSTSA